MYLYNLFKMMKPQIKLCLCACELLTHIMSLLAINIACKYCIFKAVFRSTNVNVGTRGIFFVWGGYICITCCAITR